LSDLGFWALAALLVAAALGVVLSGSLWRSAYWLAAALGTTAAFYLALTAPLLAVVQLLLYTGGVLTLVVYALVVTARSDDPRRWRRPLAAAAVSVLVFSVLASAVSGLELGARAGGLGDGRAIGVSLFSRYVVPFELLSVLLLAAIFGALAIARGEERR
jgi:NADH-quinone oxidoreductase subunit J